MTTNQVNYLNIGLMLGSLLAALVLPFEIFLLSYAILGPLHYLTEISWLHDRKYFMPHGWLAVPIAVLTLASLVTSGFFSSTPNESMQSWSNETVFGALAVSLVFVATKTSRSRGIGVLLVLVACILAHAINIEVKAMQPDTAHRFTGYEVFFAVFLTTIVHVFVFTAAFVLYGALRSRSGTGHLSFFVLLACAAACFLVPVGSVPIISDYTRHAYAMTSEVLLYELMHYGGDGITDLYASPTGVMIGRFIGFAYTYHYLNWFSKTSIIKWHQVPRLRLILVVLIWIASLALYGYKYEVGLVWLLFLSFLHVFLEFPLNWQSFFGIGRELYGRARPT